jgi:hypothetical protein
VFVYYKYVSYSIDIGYSEYKVKDDDFGVKTVHVYNTSVETAVIELYERLSLPVAPNLIRCILFAIQSKDVEDIEQIKKCNGKALDKYLPDIEKYIALL